MDHELILRAIFITAYTLICVSALVIRSRLSGSIIAKRFTALAIASIIGIAAVALELLREDLGLLKRWHLPGIFANVIYLLGLPIPLIIMALALVSLAYAYSRFAR